jgi:hypothetical protein
MPTNGNQEVIWVKRDDVAMVSDKSLRERAGIEDLTVDVRTESISRWGVSMIPAGSRDEWGTLLPDTLNVGYNQLPPEGRVFLTAPA